MKKDAPEVAEAKKGDFYIPMWLKLADLPKTLLYPLEIRDWLINDLQNGFPKEPRIAKLKISELRQTL
jgi:hypothetical protein